MNCRFVNSVLLSIVYSTGKRSFVTTSMSTSPRSNCSEACDVDLANIAESSTDHQQQENFPEQSDNSNTSFETAEVAQKQENLIDATANVSAEGAQLSKRALKRVDDWISSSV